MTSHTTIRVVCLFTLLVAAGSSAAQEVYDYSWAMEHAEGCADELLGRHGDLLGEPLSTTLVVTTRVVSDEVAERQVTLVEKDADLVEARFAQVVGSSIEEQLFELHEAEPKASADDLCSRIRVITGHVPKEKAKALRQLLTDLGEQQFALTPNALITIHGVEYKIWITSGEWEAHFRFVDSSAEGKQTAVARWVERLLALASPGEDSTAPVREPTSN